MRETELINRITFNPEIFNGKPIIRGRRLAVEHVLGMLAAGDSIEDLLDVIEGLLTPNVTLLVKGSRFMQMERIVKKFEL